MLGLSVSVIPARGQNGIPVRAIRFEGNNSFPARKLLQVITTRVGGTTDEIILARDATALRQFYQGHGFLDVQVQKTLSVRPEGMSVSFLITEGERVRIRGIEIRGNRSFPKSILVRQLPLRSAAVFTEAAIAGAEEALREFYANWGYPFVNVDGSFRRSDSLADVILDISEGPCCYVGELRVRGNETVRAATLLPILDLRVGELYSERKLRLAQRRLYATRLFRRVLFYVLRRDGKDRSVIADDTIDSVSIRFDVEEQPYRGFAFGAGFQTSPNRAMLMVEWAHDNMFSRAQTLRIGAELRPDLAGNYRLGLELTYRVPYLGSSRYNLQIHPFFYWEKLDTFRKNEYGIETGMDRQLLPQLQVGLVNRVRFMADTAGGVTNLLAVEGAFDTRDDVLDTRQGLYLHASAEAAGGILGGSSDFYRMGAEGRGFHPIQVGIVGAVRLMLGKVVPYGRIRRVPYYEEFSLGGRNNLRGYPDRAVGPDTAPDGQVYGPAIINVNAEVRSPYAFGWLGTVVFVDLGYVGEKISLDTDYLVRTGGLGLRVRTPIGPVRVDWGRRLGRGAAGERGRFYLGILQAF
ncbi:MAG: BamA/TamA family outer membrane protein [candidate division WOR-3 bacterium]